MKTTIRYNTFETNSSSVHALILVPADVLVTWREHPDFWLDFDELLEHDWGNDRQVEANVDCLVSENEMWDRRGARGARDGYYVDDDEVLTINMVPLDALSNPSNWQSQFAGTWMKVDEKSNGDILLSIDYSA